MNNIERWNAALQVILKQEGGLTDDKTDPGGITNYGISLRWLREISEDIDHDGDVDADDIRALTKSRVSDIYKEKWWDRGRYNELIDLDIAIKVFSLAINMGASRAHKILQESINRISDNKIVVDGIIGTQTLNAANQSHSLVLLDEIELNAAHYYMNLVCRNRKFDKYLLGWLRRAFD